MAELRDRLLRAAARVRGALAVVVAWLPVVVVFAVILAVVLLAGWIHSCGEVDVLREANNARARQDSTRLVAQQDSIRVYQRLVETAENEKELARLELAVERRAREKAELDLVAVYRVAISYRNRLEGTTMARPDSGNSVIPLAKEDGSLSVEGEVTVRNHQIPASAEIDYWLEVRLRELGIRARALVDPRTCAPSLEVTVQDPHVESVKIDGAVDPQLTCLPEKKKGFPWKTAAFIAGLVTGIAATR